MKNIRPFHTTVRIALLFIVFFAVPVLSSFLPVEAYFQKWIAVIILVLLSYFLYKKEGRNLSALGLQIATSRFRYFPIGLIIGIAVFCTLLFFQKLYNGIGISLNPDARYPLVLLGLLLALPGVLMEELIFRGYCFQKAIGATGFNRANFLFAFLFVVWHWVALNAWGNYAVMLSLFTTAFGHFLFATAFRRSGTLWFPIGIHLGNNWAARNLFGYQMAGSSDAKYDAVYMLSDQGQVHSTFHTVTSYLITFGVFLLFSALISWWHGNKPADIHT